MTEIEASIIVPVYKAEKYLEKCLDTLVQQMASNYEVILIDDGSPDHSGKICNRYAKKYSQIIVFHQENRGVTKTREIGVEKARGKYIIWVDADDYADENLVLKVVNTFKETGADLVVYGTRDIESGMLTEVHLPQKEDLSIMQEKSVMGRYSTLWNFSAPRSMLIGNHVPVEVSHSAEDGYLAIQLFMKAKKIAVIEEPLYYHLIDSPGSLRHTYNGKIYMGNFYLWYYRLKMCKARFPNHVEYCAERAFSGAVKAYCMASLMHDLPEKSLNDLINVIRKLKKYSIPMRWRDKFLGWCILHDLTAICRLYAKYKVMKTKRQNNRIIKSQSQLLK